MLLTYAPVFAGSFAVAVACVWVLGHFAGHLGLVDHPEGRKAHGKSTPLIGGIAVAAASLLAAGAWFVFSGNVYSITRTALDHAGFFTGAAMLAIMGIIDDRRPMPAKVKLLVQIVACLLAVFADGALVGDVGIPVGKSLLFLGPLIWPFTIIVMLTITNAINMIDGIDGLAGGISFVAFALMMKAVLTAGFGSAPYIVALTGAIAGFLIFNFPWRPGHSAKTFLGDAGSLVFGFTLAYLAIQYSSLPNRVFKPSTALWFFFIPVADTVWLCLRRMWTAGAPFAPGRDHIHHLLMEHLTPGKTAWVLVGSSALLAGGAYFAERRGALGWVLILIWIAAFLLYGLLTHKAWKAAWIKSRSVEAEPAKPADDKTPNPAAPIRAVVTAEDGR